ncbi:hypothetical protein [Chryseobacterium sp.]|uniref:hypothetical protein n=1 Tax=Chryseobacterium sp. TaxID=1871047 RepID=UPI0011C94058|nr:hypothetical protein [Chryseobacterium sp.]TXF76325.1 hypothetical protein FUA25_10595 [Chryseobacterium sp.]
MKKLVLSLVLVGFGSFAMAQVTPAQKEKMQQRRAEMVKNQEQKREQHFAEMQKELNLTQSQLNQIHAIQERHQAERKVAMQRNQEMRKQKMEGMKQNMQQMDDEMRKILTSDQYAKWQAKKQQKMLERKAKMKKHRAPMGGKKAMKS